VAGLIAALFMTVAVALYIGWLMDGVLWQGMNLLMVVIVLLSGLYYLTSARPKWRPYQLLVEVLLVVVIPPAMAFFLQSETVHRFLTPVVIGLVPLYLAYRILEMLKSFGEDQQQGRRTLVVAIGWERAMVLHNVLILLGYVVLALVTLLGFPWRLIWPVFLTLPIGLLAVWLMERARRGKKPLWRVMQIAAASVLLIPIYLIAFAFWIR
jgi:1,4-dihydroxy-2-naphthoate octaprenyltransferase